MGSNQSISINSTLIHQQPFSPQSFHIPSHKMKNTHAVHNPDLHPSMTPGASIVHGKAYQTIIEPTVHQHHHPRSNCLQHDWPLSLACLKRLKLWHGTRHSLSIKAREKFPFGNLIAKTIYNCLYYQHYY